MIPANRESHRNSRFCFSDHIALPRKAVFVQSTVANSKDIPFTFRRLAAVNFISESFWLRVKNKPLCKLPSEVNGSDLVFVEANRCHSN